MTTPVRAALVEALEAARALLGEQAVRDRWHDPSALPLYDVASLCGHLLSGVAATLRYLDQVVDAEPAPRESYFGPVPAGDDNAAQAAIRERGRALAEHGPDRLVELLRDVEDQLRQTLPEREPNAAIAVFGDRVMRVDDYLETRVVELAVHLDDLVASIGEALPVPERAVEIAVEHLVAVAVARHGALGVLRALARRERDVDDALRVL